MRRTLLALACAAAACSGGPEAGSTGPSTHHPSPVLTYAGSFHPVAHGGMGMAQVYLTGSTAELRFTADFATQGGPNLEVWLTDAADLTDNASVLGTGYVSLGPLKGASGAQEYPIPAGVDPARYHSVTVWCVDARVNFTTAPLAPK